MNVARKEQNAMIAKKAKMHKKRETCEECKKGKYSKEC